MVRKSAPDPIEDKFVWLPGDIEFIEEEDEDKSPS